MIKSHSPLFLAICIISFFLVSCQVAVDPKNNAGATAYYQANTLIATVETDVDTAFRASIQALDSLNYFRTGEVHKEEFTTILSRKVGDERVVVKISKITPEQSQIQVRIGIVGNLPESQSIIAEILDNLNIQ
jgi:hypothetical protein